MKRFKQKKRYTPKRIYAFSNIESYLQSNKEYAEIIFHHLKDNIKIAQNNQIVPRTPEYISYIQDSLNLHNNQHSRLYPLWISHASDIDKKHCLCAFESINTILHHKILSRSHVRVCKAIDNSICYKNKIQMLPYSKIDEWCHELGHWIEFHNYKVKLLCNLFLEYRTQNQEIKEKTIPNQTFKYKEGNFIYEYCGKICGVWKKNRDTEILSKGLEMLFLAPTDLFRKDWEYFTFIICILKGNIIKNLPKYLFSPNMHCHNKHILKR